MLLILGSSDAVFGWFLLFRPDGICILPFNSNSNRGAARCLVVIQLVVPKSGEMIATVIKPVRSEYDVQVERQRIIEEEVGIMEEEAGRIYTQVTGKEEF